MPPTDDVKGSLAKLLQEFYEGYEDEDGNTNNHAFYDFYEIGGRWSGNKLIAKLGKKNITKFRKALVAKKFTVSGLVWGKEQLKPESQIPMVDALWNKFFPESPVKVCPLFQHYKGDYGDVMPISDIPKTLKAHMVLVASPEFTCEFRVEKHVWNGTNIQDTSWNGNVLKALEMYRKKIQTYNQDWVQKNTPKDNWLCVTVDYHC